MIQNLIRHFKNLSDMSDKTDWFWEAWNPVCISLVNIVWQLGVESHCRSQHTTLNTQVRCSCKTLNIRLDKINSYLSYSTRLDLIPIKPVFASRKSTSSGPISENLCQLLTTVHCTRFLSGGPTLLSSGAFCWHLSRIVKLMRNSWC